LGEDWNSIEGGNSDLGDAITAIADGYVSDASDNGGTWGSVIRFIHRTKSDGFVESIYGHCHFMAVEQGEYVKRGQFIGTIGNVDGLITARLHF
jgi:murein DD-endopeptidase MepM/ murein hydrolase activator NlpD